MQSILGNSRKADIVFNKTGSISITSYIAKILKLAKGDVIDVLKDDDEIFLYVKHHNAIGRHEGMVYPTNKKGSHFRTSSKTICDFILKECKAKDKVELCVGEPNELKIFGIVIPIITKLRI